MIGFLRGALIVMVALVVAYALAFNAGEGFTVSGCFGGVMVLVAAWTEL